MPETVSKIKVHLNLEDLIYQRGIVYANEQGVTYSPCFENTPTSLIDHTGRLQKRLSTTNEPLLYIEFTGIEQLDGTGWEIHKVHLMGGDHNTCQHQLEGIEVRAAGENPVWIADIQEGSIKVHNYENLTKYKFTKDEPANLAGAEVWSSQMDGKFSHSLELRLSPEICRDSYGTEYQMSALMRLNGKNYYGCARRGNLDLVSLKGIYQAQIPELEGVQRTILLELQEQGVVVITEDYHNDQPPVVHKGNWRRLAKQKWLIDLNDIGGSKVTEILLLKRGPQGYLELKSDSAIYGDKGLRFIRTDFLPD